MTKESVKNVVKALGLVSVAVGGYGSLLCVPFAMTSDLNLITTAGIYFVAGGTMITGGLITVSLLLQPEK